MFIFTNHWEEIKQFLYIFLALLCCTSALCSIRIQVISKLLKYGKGSCRIKVKYISIFFSLEGCTHLKQTRILCPECCLHIKCRRTHITKHEYCCPFRYSNSCCKLSYRQCNSLFMLGNGSNHFIIRFHSFVIIVQFSITSSKNDLILLEYWMLF